MTVTKRKKIADGLLVPVEAVTEYLLTTKDPAFRGKPWQRVHLRVDEARSRWNEPIAAQDFQIAFPQGTRVIDEIHQVYFISGKHDPGQNLEQVAEFARGKLPIFRDIRPAASYGWIWMLLGGTLLVATVVTILLRRRARLRRGVPIS